jgi:hypothetical protein
MAVDKSCILFDGGKKIKLSPKDDEVNNSGIKMSRDDKGNWHININVVIDSEEANNVIFKFSDLGTSEEDFEKLFPNMPYFSGLNPDSDESIPVKLDVNSELVPSYDRELGGSITLKMNIENFGKTQNPKTQNVHT